MDLIKNKKYKSIFAQLVFLACVFMAVFHVGKILDMRNTFAEEMANELNKENKNVSSYEEDLTYRLNISQLGKDPSVQMTEQRDEINKAEYVVFPLWYEAIWQVVNVIFYLFVGTLIYAKNRGFEN